MHRQAKRTRRSARHEGGRFHFLTSIGSGAMGSVWLAYDAVLGRRVAVKRARVASPLGLLRLKREFRVVAPLRHPGLVAMHDLWSGADGAFFTMDHVEGRDLRAVLRSGLASRSAAQRVAFATEIAAQVTSALAHLHEHGVVHRDVKPSNVMIGVDGGVRLVDFGLLAVLDAERAASFDRRPAGTPPYVAPEQARGGAPNPASDLYALGVMVREIVTGRAAGCGSGHDDVPGRLGALCDALLQEEPARRPDARSALAMLGCVPRPLPPGTRAAKRAEASGLHAPIGPATAWLADRLAAVGDGAFVGSVVDGPALSGKSALLRWVQQCVTGLGGLAFLGSATPDEHVAYNVIDAAVDALGALLADTPLDAELATDLALASAAFPVLAICARSAVTGEARDGAFDALIRVLASLAGAEGVFLLIDDLEKADDDSLAFLARLLERKPRGVALVATLRREGAPASVRAWLDRCSALAGRRLDGGDQPARISLAS